jgi:hypothetical protein
MNSVIFLRYGISDIFSAHSDSAIRLLLIVLINALITHHSTLPCSFSGVSENHFIFPYVTHEVSTNCISHVTCTFDQKLGSYA